jgi:C-terminal processing protease CtpA/Prc
MRFLSSLALLLISCCKLYAQTTLNGGFETLNSKRKPTGWNLAYNTGPAYRITLDSAVKLHGKYSVAIAYEAGKGRFGAISHHIRQTFIGKKVTLFGSIKTENVEGMASLFLSVNGVNGQIDAADMVNKKLSGTNDWQDFYIQMPYSERDAISLDVGAFLVGNGKIWVDSLRLYVDDAPLSKAPVHLLKAINDTAFNRSSGISHISLNKEIIYRLTLLGQWWGFLKYHHPAIAKGDYNWDNELFRLLPRYLKCRTNAQASALLEKWVDRLGKPQPCRNCRPWTALKNIASKPDYGSIFTNNVFSNSLKAKLKYVLNNHESNYNYYISLPLVPAFTHESSLESLYPDAGYRLLSLYRYWNMMQYFNPNRNLISEDWNTILPQFIPQIVNAHDQTDYILTLSQLIAHIHDGHAFIQSAALEQYQGKYRLPVAAHFVEDKLVVTGYYKDTLEAKRLFKVGDVITAINGVKVNELMRRYLPLLSASNYDSKLRDMPRNYLLRSNNKQFEISLLQNGKVTQVLANAAEVSKINAYNDARSMHAKEPGYYLLNKDIGYIFSAMYKTSNLQDIKNAFKNTKGIVIDMRAYPSDEMEQGLGGYIKSDRSSFAKFSQGSLAYPGLFTFTEASVNGKENSDHYKGKVVVLVNALTQSNAEFVTMALQSAPNVVVVGSTTAGADGNITLPIALPGMVHTFISGLGAYYPDGTTAQRSGVKINYVIRPTIKAIAEGRDEVLQKAKELILK